MTHTIKKSRRTHAVSGVLALVLIVASPQRSIAADSSDAVSELTAPKQNVHLYLLIGQSNMSGRGEMSPSDRLPVAGVYVLDSDNHWKQAAHPLHFDKPKIAGVGLGIDFATQMRMSDPSVTIGLVPCAVGGTSLKQWSKGGELYEAAVARTKHAEQHGVLRGILWHQGEGDCGEKSASTYAQRLARLIADLRSDLGQPTLPFVLGEIGEFRVGVKGRSDLVIEQQQSVPGLVEHTACVSAEGLGHKGDFSHFDAEALREFGRRYAAEMQSLGDAARK
ncbi:Carbohydrate acetyl esterase/feruloyl esterase precursor [Pirellulimonas nuda]|uniref:Carbohydrate acetyl esterase/feruloyl esterase n=1 Tax=Pirellulimonas nuda TaxID=2528009 RepID=A0A518DIY3_9BACT|nr:sialate O-acetylesterase [Pirellulimonas nuda]QDU91439.1 Carbohydrate acetyl esterase/feruloyl esterase precursor [Pirellulimonas nuda]